VLTKPEDINWLNIEYDFRRSSLIIDICIRAMTLAVRHGINIAEVDLNTLSNEELETHLGKVNDRLELLRVNRIDGMKGKSNADDDEG